MLVRQPEEEIHHLFHRLAVRFLLGIAKTLEGMLLHENQASAIGCGSDRLELIQDIDAAPFLLQHALHSLRLALDASQAAQEILAQFVILPRCILCHFLYLPL